MRGKKIDEYGMNGTYYFLPYTYKIFALLRRVVKWRRDTGK
jgi:hypothetical protein